MLRSMLMFALVLGAFAISGAIIVSLSYEGTAERIEYNRKVVLLRNLHAVIGPEEHDNDIFSDVITVTAPEVLGTDKPMQIYRARKDGMPIAALLTPVAPDGYNGRIRLLVGIYYGGHVAGVRVIEHHETPGLGDAIEARKSDWILGFDNRSLGDPVEEKWKVKRDGGEFDQMTGATITPRAVVKMVYRSLKYFQQHRDEIFTTLPMVEG